MGQRAVRIQLEQARISGQTGKVGGIGGRVGGIPGFWVEKSVISNGLPRYRGGVKDGVREGRGGEELARSEGQGGKGDGRPVVLLEDGPIRDIQEDSNSRTDESRTMPHQETEQPKSTNLERKDDNPPVVPAVPESREPTTSSKLDVLHSVDRESEPKPTMREVKRSEEPIPSDGGEVAGVKGEVIPEVQVEDSKASSTRAEVLTTKQPPTESPVSGDRIVEEVSSAPQTAIEEPEVPAPQTAVELDDVEQRPVRFILPLQIPTDSAQPQVILRPSKVPSSRIGRLFHYGCKSPFPSSGFTADPYQPSSPACPWEPQGKPSAVQQANQAQVASS